MRPTGRTATLWLIGVVLLVVAFGIGNKHLVWPGLFLLLLPLVALASALVRRPRFSLHRELTPPLGQAGETLAVRVRVTAERQSPLTSVFAQDVPDPELGRGVRFRLAASRTGEVTKTEYRLTPRRRGRYRLKDFTYRYTDFLGLWMHTVPLAASTTVIVRPGWTWLPGRGAQSYGVTGETPIPQTAISGPDDAMVREYQSGDDVRRIHWPSTARIGSLIVRREEAAWDPTAWIVLDSRAGVHPLLGSLSPSFEVLVSAAASVGVRLLGDGYSVSLLDAKGTPAHVDGSRPDAVDRWLDPLVDVGLTGTQDLLKATAALSRSGGEHLIVALLGELDRGVAEALSAASAPRQDRIVLALPPTHERRSAWDTGAAILSEHGWRVRVLPTGADGLATAWAEQGFR